MFGSSKYTLYHSKGYNFLNISGDRKSAGDLVLVHGMFGGLSNFDSLIDRLDGYSIYVPDIPLYNIKSSSLNIKDLAGWLHGFVSAMHIKNPILLGNSLGGHISLEYARLYPPQVRALVLTGSSGLLEYDFGSTFPKRKSRAYIKEQANKTFYEDLANDEIIDELEKVVRSRKKILSLLKLTRSTHSHNMEDMLPDIEQPTLLIWGKQDVITPPKVAKQFKSLLPNAQLRWIDRCGHAPMMERPEQFTAYVKTFLTELEQESRTKPKIV